MNADPPLPLSAFRGYFVETVARWASDAPSVLVVGAAPFRFLRLKIPVESVVRVDEARRCVVITEPLGDVQLLTSVAGFFAAVAHDLRTALRSSRE